MYFLVIYYNCLNIYSVERNLDFLKMKVEWDIHGTLWLFFLQKWNSALDHMFWANWIIYEPRCYQSSMYWQSKYCNRLNFYGMECNPVILLLKAEKDLSLFVIEIVSLTQYCRSQIEYEKQWVVPKQRWFFLGLLWNSRFLYTIS